MEKKQSNEQGNMGNLGNQTPIPVDKSSYPSTYPRLPLGNENTLLGNYNKSVTQLTIITLVAQLTQLTQNNILNTNQLILLNCIEPKLIKELADTLNKELILISKKIYRKDRNTGLLIDELVEKKEIGDKTYYQTTEKGINELKIIYEKYQLKESLKDETERNKNRKVYHIKLSTDYFTELYQKYPDRFQTNGIKAIEIDFKDLARYDIAIANDLLDNPNETLKIMEIGLIEFNDKYKNYKIRIKNLPDSCKVDIAEIRCNHLNRFVKIIGIVNSVTTVNPSVVMAKFECPSCGNIISIPQEGKLFKEPTKCGCGRKGKFFLQSKELVDYQILILEETVGDIGMRTNPQKIKVILQNELTNIEKQPSFENNEIIQINGLIKEEFVELRNGKGNKLEISLEANNIEFKKDIKQIELSKDEIKEIVEFTKQENHLSKLIKSFAPNICNMDNEKKTILFSIVSGGNRNSKVRDDSHILIVGDPGLAKSKLMIEGSKLCISRWFSGKGATGAGLIGTVVKDKALGEIMLQKGALPLANNNVCFGDELDKMSVSDTDSLHEPLENQFCKIDKWNKHAKFITDCTLIAAANPKYGRFDVNGNYWDQILLPSALKDRFDIILIMIDEIGTFDKEISDKVLDKFIDVDDDEELLEYDFIRRYLYYARNNFNPKLTNETKKLIQKAYFEFRSVSNNTNTIKIGVRHLEGLARLTRASAKLNLRNVVKKEDALNAIELMNNALSKFNVNIDIKIIEEVVNNKSPANNTAKLLSLFNNKELISFETINKELNLKNDSETEQLIEKLKITGDIFEPKQGMYQRI